MRFSTKKYRHERQFKSQHLIQESLQFILTRQGSKSEYLQFSMTVEIQAIPWIQKGITLQFSHWKLVKLGLHMIFGAYMETFYEKLFSLIESRYVSTILTLLCMILDWLTKIFVWSHWINLSNIGLTLCHLRNKIYIALICEH